MSDVREIPGVSLNEDVGELVKKAEKWAETLYWLSSTQIRKLHNHITRIWNKYIYGEYSDRPEKFKELGEEIEFTKVFLTYQITRLVSSLEGEKRQLLKQFKEKMEKLFESVNNQETFERLKKFFDAFLAYHKFYSEFKKSEKKEGGMTDGRTQQKASR